MIIKEKGTIAGVGMESWDTHTEPWTWKTLAGFQEVKP